MKRIKMKWFVRKHLPFFRLLNNLRLLCTRRKSYLFRKGWVSSIMNGYPSDLDGQALPWMNYSFIFFISQRINKKMVLLEFGTGYSTIFWAKRTQTVYTIENDPFFLDYIKKELPGNVETLISSNNSNKQYSNLAKKISESNNEIKFDMIVIDGIDRVNCCINSLDYLKFDGVVIWDDSSRTEYTKGFEYLHSKGFKKLEFEGLKPGDRTVDRTAVFYREQNCLGL